MCISVALRGCLCALLHELPPSSLLLSHAALLISISYRLVQMTTISACLVPDGKGGVVWVCVRALLAACFILATLDVSAYLPCLFLCLLVYLPVPLCTWIFNRLLGSLLV